MINNTFAINLFESIFALLAIVLIFDELEAGLALNTGCIVDETFVFEAVLDIVLAAEGKAVES